MASPAASVAIGLFGLGGICASCGQQRGAVGRKALETLSAGWGNRGLGEVSLWLG